MSLSNVRANCLRCEKVIEFNIYGEFKDYNIDEEKPIGISSGLAGAIIICKGCDCMNLYMTDHEKDWLEEWIPYDL